MSDKVLRLKKSIPPPYDTRDFSTLNPCYLGKICTAIGLSDQDVADQIGVGWLESYLGTATDVYLSAMGSNVGVPRPPAAPFDDNMYRQIVSLLGFTSKCTLYTLYTLMDIVFGTRAFLSAHGIRPWAIYVVNPCEIVIEIPGDLFGTTQENATYLHGIDGKGFTDPTLAKPYFYVYRNIPGEYNLNPYGMTLTYYDGSLWQTRIIQNWTWNGSFTELLLDSNMPINSVDTPYVISTDSPAHTHTGDYLQSDAAIKADTATTPAHDLMVYLSGHGKLEVVDYYIDLGIVVAAGVVIRYEFL